MSIFKKIIVQFLISIYLFVLIGFFIHTSDNPSVLWKYSTKYFIILVLLTLGFSAWIWGLFFLLKTTTVKRGKRKFTVTPLLKIVICLTIIFLVLGTVEIYYRQKYKDVESNTYLFRIENYHPYLGNTLHTKDNLHINSWGFRGDEIKKEKSPHTYRIILLGGSTVLNRPLPYGQTFGKLLQDRLQQQYPDKKIEILNAGNDWYTTEHSLIQYLFSIREFNPDLVIMWHGVNDLFRSCTSGRFSHGEYRSDYSNFYGPTTTMVKNYFRPQPFLQIKFISFDFLKTYIIDNLYSDITRPLAYKRLNQETATVLNNVKDISGQKFPSVSTYARNLEELISTLKRDNVPLVLGNQAYLYHQKMTTTELSKIVFPKLYCEQKGIYPNITTLITQFDTINNVTQSLAKKNNVLFLDLENNLPKNLEYFTDDVHYTEGGNKKITELLFQFIQHNNLIFE